MSKGGMCVGGKRKGWMWGGIGGIGVGRGLR